MNVPFPPRARVATALLAGALFLAMPLAALAPSATAAAGQTLRWKFDTVRGYIYKLDGGGGSGVFDDELERTLYASDIADGRVLAELPLSVESAVLNYAFRLPKEAVSAKSKWTVHDTYPGRDTGQGRFFGNTLAVAPFTFEGKGEVTNDPAATVEIRQVLDVKPAVVSGKVVDKATVTIEQVFDVEKGAVTSATFNVSWGAGPAASSLKGKIEIERPLPRDARALVAEAAEAVGRGTDTLRKELENSNYFANNDYPLGMLSLVLLALERAGDDPDAPHMKAGFEALYKLVAEKDGVHTGERTTYAISLAILAIEGKSVKRADSGTTSIRYEKGELSKEDLELLQKLVGWLCAGRLPNNAWTYPSPKEIGDTGGGGGGRGGRGGGGGGRGGGMRGEGDLSNTQFAILALHSASRAGVPVNPKFLIELSNMMLGLQAGADPMGKIDLAIEWEPDAGLAGGGPGSGTTTLRKATTQRVAHGFGYEIKKSSAAETYQSMSAAGVSSLEICREELLKAKALDENLGKSLLEGIFDGLGWLDMHYTMRSNWGLPQQFSHFYCLYSLEKAFEIGKIATIGGHDWWSEGATELLLVEGSDAGSGHMRGGGGGRGGRGGRGGGGGGRGGAGPGHWGNDTSDTAFAILFLTRASSEPEIHVKAAGRESTGTATDDDAVNVPGVGVVSAKEVLAATEASSPDKRKDRIALSEKIFDATSPDDRPKLAPALGKLLASRYPEVAKMAAKWLATITGGKVADESAAQAFFARWDEARKIGLIADAAGTGRLMQLLHDPLPGVRRAAALGLSRLGAIQAIPDLIAELKLDDKDYRSYIRSILGGMLGADPGFDDAKKDESIEKWQAAWDTRREELLRRAAIKADIEALGKPEARDEAKKRLVAAGKPAVRALIDALSRDGLRETAGLALQEITGKKLPAEKDAWEAWFREEGAK